jgi:hypothetical protein
MHALRTAPVAIACVFAAGVLGGGCTNDDSGPQTRQRTSPGPPPAAAVCPKSSLPVRNRVRTRCLRTKVRKAIYGDLARIRDQGAVGEKAFAATARRHAVPIAIVHAIAREGAVRNWPVPPAPVLPAAPIRSTGGDTAAKRLAATPRCSETEPGKSITALRWRPAARPGRVQRIVVTIFRNFAQGKLDSSGPLPSGRSTFEWHRVHGQAIHSWRVLTRQRGGWAASPIGRFTGPTCVGDLPGDGTAP